jgi:hypothetical protein
MSSSVMLRSTPWYLSLLATGFFLLLGFAPGSLPFSPDSPFSDAAISHWPSALFIRESVLEHGEFPLWRDTLMGGQPFAANPLNKTAYPFQWLVLLFPAALHLNLLILLHIGIAVWGMGRWLKGLELRQESIWFGALAYALSPRLLGHLGAGHLDLVYALAWFPWLMESVRRGAHLQKGYRWVALFATLLVLADVRLALFALSTALAYGIKENLRPPIRPWLGTGLLFLLLTASVTIPLLGWQTYLSRSELSSEEAGVFSLEPAALIGIVIPQHEGNIEALTYVGLTVVVLAFIGIVAAPRQHALWLVMMILAALYALGSHTPFWSVLVSVVPGLSWFRVPARAWFVVALIMPLLSSYGLEVVLNTVERRAFNATTRRVAFAWIAAAGSCGAFTLLMLPIPASVGVTILVAGFGLGVLLFGAFNGWIPAPYLAGLVILLTFFDLAWMGHSWLEWRSPDDWLEPYRPIATRLQAEEADRIYSPTYSIPQAAAAEYNLKLFGGVDPLQLSGVVAGIQQGGGVRSDDYSIVQPPLLNVEGDDLSTANRNAMVDTKILGEWRVSHVAAAYPVDDPGLEFVDEIDGVYLYRNQDYVPTEARWPENWDKLPSENTILKLNRITWVTALISGLAFVALVGWLVWRP